MSSFSYHQRAPDLDNHVAASAKPRRGPTTNTLALPSKLKMDNIEVGAAGKKGQGLFAKRALSTKDTIYTLNEPALIAISTSKLSKFCYSCYAGSKPKSDDSFSIGLHQDARLQICTGCQVAHFCGKACQTRAWTAFHKYECKIFNRLRSKGTLPEITRALLRFILLHDKDALLDQTWSRVINLESHVDKLRESQDWLYLMVMAKACHEYSSTNVSYDMVLKLVCILKINGIVLTTTYGDEIGVFLDPLLVKMNHSCDGGNIVIHRPIYTNHTGWLQARKDDQALIKLFPSRAIAQSEELTITYVEHTESIQRRQQHLKERYNFDCTCDKCKSDQRIENDRERDNPSLCKALQNWSDTYENQYEKLRDATSQQNASHLSEILTEVAGAMQREPGFSYGWHPYPQVVHELKLLSMNDQIIHHQALSYALKEFLLVGPAIFHSPLTPRRIVHAIYLIQLLALSTDTSSPGRIPEQNKQSQKQGLSRISLIYWRLKICADMEKTLSESPATDLAEIFMFEQLVIEHNYHSIMDLVLRDENAKLTANEEMRILLELPKIEWESMSDCWQTQGDRRWA